jgi:hypothetical protein
MATDLLSSQELMGRAKTEIQNRDATLTDFNDGSLLDIITGVMATMISEGQRVTVDQFSKTFVETANGPEVTGGVDDLANLLVDHFGSEFARPQATNASGIVTFSRATTAKGNVTIPAGTIVKTAPNASGKAQRYATQADVIMTGLTINASVLAVVAGSAGNSLANQVSIIESTLTDTSIVVNNAALFSGGTDVATDSQYREYARSLFASLRGATLAAVAAKALTVAGVVQAVPVEQIQTVIQYDNAGHTTSGSSFQISRNYLYIADANGSASQTLINAVQAAIASTRAGGVAVNVIGASAVVQNVTFSVVLNGAGPNFAALSASLAMIIQDMTIYIQSLPIGTGFSRVAATAAIMAKWGPSGSNDLASLTITAPTGDVAITSTQTLIPGTIASA